LNILEALVMVTYCNPIKVWTPPQNWDGKAIQLKIAILNSDATQSATPTTAQTADDVRKDGKPSSGGGGSNSASPGTLPPSPFATPVLPVQIDTGSQGILIPGPLLYENQDYTITYKNNIPTEITGSLLPGVECLNPAQVIYQPSSDDIHGFLYSVPGLAIGVAGDAPIATTGPVTLIGAFGKTPYMMGVGVGRPHLADNAFLFANSPTAGDEFYPSFLITSQGIWLGCQPGNVSQTIQSNSNSQNPVTFYYQKLVAQKAPAQGTGNGNAPGTAAGSPTSSTQSAGTSDPANTPSPTNPSGYALITGGYHIQAPNSDGQAVTPSTPIDYTPCGILIDTGLEVMLMNAGAPDDQQTRKLLTTQNTSINIEVNATTDGQSTSTSGNVGYQFTITGQQSQNYGQTTEAVGTTDNTEKDVVSGPAPGAVLPQGPGAYVNTGINFLQAYHFYYDGPNAQVGFASVS
jgi:hypothetical protein